jgi:hypothetical protein
MFTMRYTCEGLNLISDFYCKPHVNATFDIELPDLGGVAIIRQIEEVAPNTFEGVCEWETWWKYED